MTNTSSTKTIAQNTFFLYFRMLAIMFVSFYTVRIVLSQLGTEDYGIYNVVGGIVFLFAMISNTLSSSTQRFLSFEIGSSNSLENLRNIFKINILFYVILCLLVVILSETLGLWFVNTQLIIPENRLLAANWVYQFSILSFICTIITVPYTATIIAHEEMKVYAWISILEVILKLIIVFCLSIYPMDKLILYSFLFFISSLFISSAYIIYCIKHFPECKFGFYYNKQMCHEQLSFMGLNFYGSITFVLRMQGTNILLNIFFGPLVNAARALAFKISSAINSFVLNFIIAFKPAITKSYANNDKRKTFKLTFLGIKVSYFMLLLIAFPCILEMKYLLQIWLKEIPQYTVLFSCLAILEALFESLSHPLESLSQATGQIKKYQLITKTIELTNLPICYILLINSYPPESSMYLSIVLSIIGFFTKLYLLQKQISFPLVDFIRNVLSPLIFTTLLMILIGYISKTINLGAVTNIIINLLLGLIIIISIGLSKSERNKLISMFYLKIKK